MDPLLPHPLVDEIATTRFDRGDRGRNRLHHELLAPLFQRGPEFRFTVPICGTRSACTEIHVLPSGKMTEKTTDLQKFRVIDRWRLTLGAR